MKRSLIAIVTVIIVGASGLAIAQMDKGKGMMGLCPMMKSMMGRSIVATSDGGIVVVMGNKLTKYDKDLNVAKEVELKMDMEGMKKMMGEMMEKCPMMGGQDGKTDAAPTAEAGHASHH